MAFDKPAVVIDNGSYSIKAGFACDNHPVSMFRTVVGRPSYLQGKYGREPYVVYLGDDAVEKVDELELNHPVVKGQIVQWDNMERIWHHVFYRELKVAPEDRSVIITCDPQSTMKEKVKCCEIMFESLNAPAICIQSQPVLALYGSGFTTGITVDMGYDSVNINPIYEGGLISYAQMQTGLAGYQITNYIKSLLHDRNLDLGVKTAGIIEGIKKDCVYVTKDAIQLRDQYKRKYRLPSGEILEVGDEAFRAGEMLFQPDLVVGEETRYLPLGQAVITAATKCDAELRPELYDAVVPCGGLAMIPGFNERLASDIEETTHRPVNIVQSTEAYTVSWLGGATFAGLTEARKVWVLKKQFEDFGAKIVKNKFL